MWKSVLMLVVTGLLVIGGWGLTNPRNVVAQGTGFIMPNTCYRISFPIESPPNYKVLEVLDSGWIRAEVDAGPAGAKRPSMWVNTAQIISMRQVSCSQ
ncbi:MAG TPA: hypothetical protein VFZ21_25585 [Gemmatimonadaceae bacterium]|nr:hypothetical protein [Gemmatimonadaceae bacterium]